MYIQPRCSLLNYMYADMGFCEMVFKLNRR